MQFLLSGVHNEPGIFFAFCTNRLRREISTPKASHDSFAVMNKGKRLTSTRRPSSQYVESKNLTIFNIIRWDDESTEKSSHCTVWWSNVYFNRLGITQWDSGLWDRLQLADQAHSMLRAKILQSSIWYDRMMGRQKDRPTVWWSNVYFNRLVIGE